MKEIIDGILLTLLISTILLGMVMVWLGVGLGNWVMVLVGVADVGLVVGSLLILQANKLHE